jgi:acetylornithine deacetylase/succinyl-diaminopimelate desuccinylase-like protein
MVVGETGHEPVDEFQGLEYAGKDAGARHLAVHGGVADFVLVAEATRFDVGWVEAGKLLCKVTVFGGTSLYTPYVGEGDESSALLRARPLLDGWNDWASAYTRRHTYECAGGNVVPRASIGAIRAGVPYNITRTPEVCELYVDLRTAPGQSPTETANELREFVAVLGLDAKVEVFLHRPGYEARGVEPLVDALRAAHSSVFGSEAGVASGPTTSMWRDNNVWNELGIPAAMYGPGGGTGGGGRRLTVDDLHQAARVYALTAMAVAG